LSEMPRERGVHTDTPFVLSRSSQFIAPLEIFCSQARLPVSGMSTTHLGVPEGNEAACAKGEGAV
jgi:hypothetical protein